MVTVDSTDDGKNLDSTFEKFISKSVSTKKSETDTAKKRWPQVVDFLAEGLGEKFKGHFLSGSYARRVQVRRLKDVDVVIELRDVDGAFRADASATLNLFAEVLADYPGLLEVPTVGIRAVTLRFADVDFKIDIVPALPQENGRHLLAVNNPKKNENAWSLASPKLQTEAASRKNAALQKKYTPATKLVKEWNQGFGEGELKPMPSYLAESILYHALDTWNGFEDAVVRFFENAERHLSRPEPSVTCPGDPTNYVDEKLDPSRRARALQLVREALASARRAQAELDPDESLNLWANVFTLPDFPAPTNDRSKLANSLGAAGVTASAHAVSRERSGRKIPVGRSWRRG